MNRKGAPAFQTTGNACLDIFTIQSKSVTNKDEFVSLVRTMEQGLRENPKLFLRLMKYKRNTEKGHGNKFLFLLMSYVLYFSSSESVKDLLRWSKDCHKDLLQMSRIGISESLDVYAEDLTNLISKIWQGEKNLPLLPVKYLASNKGRFESQTKQIWQKVRFELTGEAANDEHAQFLKTLMPGPFTNKKQRLFKSHFDKLLHLVDDVSGKSVEELVNLLNSCSSIANQRLRERLSKMRTEKSREVLLRYCKMLQEGAKAKNHGVDLASECWNFFLELSDQGDILKAQVEQYTRELQVGIPVEVLIDISGSMNGKPIVNAFFHALILWQVCDLKRIILFSTEAEVVELPTGLDILQKIKHLYRSFCGATCLDKAIHLLETLSDRADTVLIFSDGDCDPSPSNQNPFCEALELLPSTSFIMFNLNMQEFCFPHLSDQERVCYLGGSNLKVITTAIQAILKGHKFTPEHVMELSLEAFEPPFVPSLHNRALTEQQINRLFNRCPKRLNSKM